MRQAEAQIHGYFLEDMKTGLSARFSKTIGEGDISMFAGVSGDTNPLHLDEEFAAACRFGVRLAHGMLSASLISTVIGTRLPGPGCLYMGQNLRFLAPVMIGDTVRAEVTVQSIDEPKARVVLETLCKVGDTIVIDGTAEVWVPRKSILNKSGH